MFMECGCKNNDYLVLKPICCGLFMVCSVVLALVYLKKNPKPRN